MRAAGVRRLDGVVVSHADRDHAGGAASLLAEMPTDWLLHALPADHPLLAQALATRPCFDGQGWTWDGVRFDVLQPPFTRHASPSAKSNDMSCVLRVEAGGQVLLISADIEARSEGELLARHRAELRADVLIVPHHGSLTSSSTGFLAAVDAPLALIAVGYRNRFGHPKQEILDRYASRNTLMYRSDRDGALSFELGQAPLQVSALRQAAGRYWQGQ